jgi:hypothetical protein
MLTAMMTVSSRRADVLGAAIAALGGAGQITAELSQPRRADLITHLGRDRGVHHCCGWQMMVHG